MWNKALRLAKQLRIENELFRLSKDPRGLLKAICDIGYFGKFLIKNHKATAKRLHWKMVSIANRYSS